MSTFGRLFRVTAWRACFLLAAAASTAAAAAGARSPSSAGIDRRAVVRRHIVRFAYGPGTDAPEGPAAAVQNLSWRALTVGNGGFAFTADLTGLQSLNNTLQGHPHYKTLTMSNWGWHTPDPEAYGVGAPLFGPGGLRYVYENATVSSADARRRGNRTIPYQFNCAAHNSAKLCEYLMGFPQRIGLGQLAFVLPARDAPAAAAPPPPPPPGPTGPFRFVELPEISAANQTLDMWTGELGSSWTLRGAAAAAAAAVRVSTVVDADTDTVAVRYAAPARVGLGVQLAFCAPGPDGSACTWAPPGAPGGPLAASNTTVLGNTHSAGGQSGRLDLVRTNGDDVYAVACAWNATGPMRVRQTGTHAFVLAAADGVGGAGGAGEAVVDVRCRYELVCCVGPRGPGDPRALSRKPVPAFGAARAAAAAAWGAFWTTGAAVDLAGATADPRALELERRTVQSLYLLRAQEAGDAPPQESALLYNSWHGKHHSEMRYWHQTWMPLWGHPKLLARSDAWFVDRLAQAERHAAHQGYDGARWGKMLGESNMWSRAQRAAPPAARLMYWESPNNINPGLVWHQPHVVYMAELEYQASATPAARREVLQRLSGVVLRTAAFLADFAERRTDTGTRGAHLDLGPPLVSAAEVGEDPYESFNPTYELTQFNFSLDLANTWRRRLGLPRNKTLDAVRMALAPLPVVTLPDGRRVYNRHQNCLPSVFAARAEHCTARQSHPALTGALGCLPGDAYGVDRDIMNATLHEVLAAWDWNACWGWDQPMVAMTATRLEQPEVAVGALLMSTSRSIQNVYVATGYNHADAGELSAYLPGNGGVLTAVALMAGGWKGGPAREAPGFPEAWGVRVEGFRPYF